MPAITADTLTLPRVGAPAPSDTERPVRSITTGPRGYEGEGFPVVRAFAGGSSAARPVLHSTRAGPPGSRPRHVSWCVRPCRGSG